MAKLCTPAVALASSLTPTTLDSQRVVRVGGDDKEQSDGCGVERWGRGFVTSAFEAKAVYAFIVLGSAYIGITGV